MQQLSDEETVVTQEHRKRELMQVSDALEGLFSCPNPSLGIDIDGCVDEAPLFFKLLTKCWPGKVFVISYRSDRDKAVADLARYDIHYDELILVRSFEAKAEVIREKGISIYFDDQPEMLKNVSPMVNVMLVRNEGNFCFDEKLWMFSDQTAKIV